MLQPKRTKYRKHFRGTMKGNAQTGFQLNFGEYGLKALAGGWLKSRQIEAARKVIMHHTKRQAKLWIRIFPDKVYTAKSAGTRMGQGKGDPAGWVAVVRPGKILFELAGVEKNLAQEAINKAGAKLPFKTKFIFKE